MPTGAQLLVGSLKAHGVDTIFGVPGIHNLSIYDALVDERAIRVVTTRDERGAGHMADGYARATGRPGVCLTVPGPGVTNALTAIGEAYADSSPVLLLASQLARDTVAMDREDFHQLRDADGVLRSVTQWGTRPGRAQDIGSAVDEAFRRFSLCRPRPCYLDLPMDLLGATVEARADPVRAPAPGRTAPSWPEVERAVGLLATARRPLLVVGGGAWKAGRSVCALVEQLAIPVMMTSSGKGVAVRERRRAAIRERAPDAVATLEGLRRVLPDDALVFNDINGIACWGAGAFVCRRPRTFHYPIGFGCLGFALPAAIGAKLAR